MRVRPVLSAALSCGVVVAWFLWPLDAALADPVAGAHAALRAIALFAVTLCATDVVAGQHPLARSLGGRCALAFALAFSVSLGAGIGVETVSVAVAQSSAESWRRLLESSAADALSCALALAVDFGINRRLAAAPPRGGPDA